MRRKLLTTWPVLWMLLACLLAPHLPARAVADDFTDAVSAIQGIGGSVRPMGEEWEVDFHLRGRGLTDAGLAHVAALKNVAWLNLRNTKITSAGLLHLKGLEKLRWLHLEKTEIGDEGIEHLAGLPQLEYLNLYATKITDKSLEQLAGCKNLRRLYVWRTEVTDAGVARLEKTLPELKIVRGVDLSKLASVFPAEAEPPKPKVSLQWVAVSSRDEAPARSENGINCQILFENKSARPVKLQWISYGDGALRFYATLAPGATRRQNSYSRNVWLITDESDRPLGYFVVKEEDSRAVIPSQHPKSVAVVGASRRSNKAQGRHAHAPAGNQARRRADVARSLGELLARIAPLSLPIPYLRRKICMVLSIDNSTKSAT